jgi:hypothetical protein
MEGEPSAVHQMASRFLPLALRLLMTLLPCFVDIRLKNPWVLTRFILLG